MPNLTKFFGSASQYLEVDHRTLKDKDSAMNYLFKHRNDYFIDQRWGATWQSVDPAMFGMNSIKSYGSHSMLERSTSAPKAR